MITYQFINALSDAKPQSHLIARADSSLLPDSALIAEMRQQAFVPRGIELDVVVEQRLDQKLAFDLHGARSRCDRQIR